MEQHEIKFPQEQQIMKLVEDTALRIEQFQAALQKEYNRGPELRFDPPDKWNSPDSPMIRIEQLNKAIESNKMYALKKTFEIADTLPKDRQQVAIQHAFDKLAPEMFEKEVVKDMEQGLTGRFGMSAGKEATQQQPENVRLPFTSLFFAPEKADGVEGQLRNTKEENQIEQKQPYVSMFLPEDKKEPFTSRFLTPPDAVKEIEKIPAPEKEKTDFEPGR